VGPTEPVVEVAVSDLGVPTLTVKHWGRLEDGALLATSPRLDWPKLMKRTLGVDVLACPKCSHRMRILSAIAHGPVDRRGEPPQHSRCPPHLARHPAFGSDRPRQRPEPR